MTRDSFPDGVAERLKWYVYRLIDPRNGETFYVGKGRGNRVFDHAKGISPGEDNRDTQKLRRIRAIQAAGLEVGHVIHRHGLGTDQLARVIEAAVIDAYPGLTNEVRGQGSGVYGSRHVEEIIAEYAGEEFEVLEPLMLISIGNTYEERGPYDAVRHAWPVNLNRVKRYNLVLARLRRQIVGAYRPQEWLPATLENFPEIAELYGQTGVHGRYGLWANGLTSGIITYGS